MPPSELPRLELRCFGPPTARVDGRDAPPEVLWRRHLALLVYLALSPDRTRSRSHLLGLLWPEKPEAKARHALNEALLRVRQSLGAGRLVSREDAITLDGAGLSVDVLDFDQAARRDPRRAVELVRGEFLEGLILDEAQAFEDWVTSERQRYRSRAATALVAYGESRLAESRFAEASDAGRRALALEPHTEPAARLVMRATALSGDTALALAAYKTFSDSLKAAIGEDPSRELEALSERIRLQRTPRPAAAEREVEPPLVGRGAAHRTAFETLAAGLADGPRTLFIAGAPGMGRTRLVNECVARVALEGATVALARPLPSDVDARWSTLRLLLRAGIHRAPGLVAADADALGVLAWLVPEVAERAQPREPRDAAHVASALAAALAAAAEDVPVALALDDAHLSDGATLEALVAALGRLSRARVVVVITAAEGGEAPPALLRLRSEVGRGLRGDTVRLDPLAEGELRELVQAQAPWCKDDGERDRLARRLTFETGGNPFFAVTLLGGLARLSNLRHDFLAWPRPQATFDTPLPFSVPDLVRMTIAARVAELDQEGRRVLAAASICGLALDLDVIGALTDLARSGVEDRLASAERRHLIEFDGERYAFVAPLIADVVRGECLTPGQRKALRLRALAALGPRSDLEGRVLRVELLAAAEPGGPAFEEAIVVARAALAAESPRTARRAIAAAERAAGAELEGRRPLLEGLRAEIPG